MHMRIPYYMLINAGFDRYLVFTRRYVNTSVILTAIENPQKLCDPYVRAKIMGDGSVIESGEVNHERDSEFGKKVYTTTGSIVNRWIETSVGKIYEYSLESPCLILPANFYNVYTGKDRSRSWHLVIEEAKAEIALPLEMKKIPSHVLKGFVDSLIAAKEICPVSMEPLSLGGIAVTGCYHAFDRGSMDEIMKTSRLCPSCRSGLKAEDIVLI